MSSCNGVKKRLKPDQIVMLKKAILNKYEDRIIPSSHGVLVVSINKKVNYKNPDFKPLSYVDRYILRKKPESKEIISLSLVEQVLGPKWRIEGYDIKGIMEYELD